MQAFFASAPGGVEDLLSRELSALGATDLHVHASGVSFNATLTTALRATLWSRLANRVIAVLQCFEAPSPTALYEVARAIPWEDHMSADGTLAVDAVGTHDSIGHSQFAALRVKDAVVDRFRHRLGRRPSVDTHRPDLRIQLRLHGTAATLGIDLAGRSLHQRGYRAQGLRAPLKENLAAAILWRSGWLHESPLVDPMCGSGTLLVEAALMAADWAPGLIAHDMEERQPGWLQVSRAAWQDLLEEAQQRRKEGLKKLQPQQICGFDANQGAVQVARANLQSLGLEAYVQVNRCSLDHLPRVWKTPGHVVVNPPYGERLGETANMFALYALLGHELKSRFAGWQAHILTHDEELGHATGLRAHRTHKLYNGKLPCILLHATLHSQPSTPSYADLQNRLFKNIKKLATWRQQKKISCYRLYDADLPEYAAAIDIYENRWAHVQEYAAPSTIDPGRAKARLREIICALTEVLTFLRPQDIFVKVRKRQRGLAQYEKQGEDGTFYCVHENGYKLNVNFTDYLDTGLFLDHRSVRSLLQSLASGKRFLNLFGYTGSATVAAACGGARQSTTVDLSNTYLSWAQANFELNGLNMHEHRLVKAECLDYLRQTRDRYDLIFLDPPTFSNSKKMQTTLDIQRDHVSLIEATAGLLSANGTLIFSTNARRFKMQGHELKNLTCRDITAKTLPRDYARTPRIHQCWQMERA